MKRVHATRQLMHLWANLPPSELEGFKNPQRNVYVENGKLFSYGSHYVMSTKHQVKALGTDFYWLYLINSNGYSNTTRKQLSFLRNAIDHKDVEIEVPSPDNSDVDKNIEHLTNQVCDAIDNCLNTRKKSGFYGEIVQAIDQLNFYLDWMNLKKFELPADFDQVLVQASQDKTTKAVQPDIDLTPEQIEKNRIKKLKLAEKDFNEWTASTIISSSKVNKYAEIIGYDLCKVLGSLVVTHRGAIVPLEDAQRALKLYDRSPVYLIGQKIGDFTVNESNDETKNLKIGCHIINVPQVKKAMGIV